MTQNSTENYLEGIRGIETYYGVETAPLEEFNPNSIIKETETN